MLREDVKIRFAGFEPSHDMRSSLYFLLNELYEKSPSKSFVSATFTMTNGIIEGVIKITSSAENFVAKAADASVISVGAKLVEKLTGQLERWKSLRFE